MKILHFITDLDTGGAEMMLYKLCCAINRKRFEPVVVSLKDLGVIGYWIESEGIPVYALGLRRKVPGPFTVRRFRQLLRKEQSDIIQGWMYHGNLAAYFAGLASTHSIPVVWNIRHSINDVRKEKILTRWVIKAGARLSHRPARIIYNSKVGVKQHEALGYRPEKTLMIPNGFDTEKFLPDPAARQRIRRELGISDDTLLIGLVARYHPMKDHANFLRAASRLAQQHNNIMFILAGRGVNSSNPVIGRLREQLGIRGKTILLDERRDIAQLMASLDIASSASSWGEGFPNVVGEAMASGVPCVVTDVGDSASIVGNDGLVVPPGDPAALAHAWRTLIDIGRDGRRRLGIRARIRISREFSLDRIVRRYEQLYEDVMSKNNRFNAS